jgi:competence protein ComEA
MSLVVEVPRPAPERSWRDRVADQLTAIRSRLTILSLGRLVTAAGAVLVIAAFAIWLLRAPTPSVESGLPRASSVSTVGGRSSPGSVVAASSAAPSAGMIVVQAAGGVSKPGVYRLPTGSRVTDLLAMAGGVDVGIDESVLPLAAKLVDGQRVYVPRPGEPPPVAVAVSGSSGGTGAATPAAPIDLNQATSEQLDSLPGVGPATAAAIVSYREKHGPFRSVNGLLDVPGIGDAKLNALKDLVTV